MAALLSWEKEEEQRQVAAREAARFAALEAEHRGQVALEEAQRQVAAREATATVQLTASDQGKAKRTSPGSGEGEATVTSP